MARVVFLLSCLVVLLAVTGHVDAWYNANQPCGGLFGGDCEDETETAAEPTEEPEEEQNANVQSFVNNMASMFGKKK